MSQKTWILIKDTAQVLFFAVLLTVVLRSYVVEARQIPSGSMIPTLQIGDRLLVDKITYKLGELHHRDIIVFAPPPEAQVGEIKSDYIKRIIGLPGDEIQVNNRRVFLNGKEMKEPYIAEPPEYNFGPVIVPDDSLFVMGDNRNNSFDSHAWGFLPMANIKGRAFFRFWPPNRIGIIESGK
ncbi:MAG TPA: signal peptidase I [Desulfobacteria bacterium]|nr:signal peptidase I [Desulfobacteria bacterium]